jgi:hypothetical protein
MDGRQHDVALGVDVTEPPGQSAQDLVVNGLEDHAVVDAHVGDPRPAGLEDEGACAHSLVQAFGALIEARVAHHADFGDRSGHVGNSDAHLQ